VTRQKKAARDWCKGAKAEDSVWCARTYTPEQFGEAFVEQIQEDDDKASAKLERERVQEEEGGNEPRAS
jgi:hypothetical protein